MAPSRPYWKGYLKLSLVSCPVSLYSATSSSERVSFRQINRATGNRLRQQMIDEVTREPVEGSDKARGYEYAKNTYVLVDDEELDAIAIESNHTIEIDKFVPRAQIDERYYESPHYLVPNDPVGQEAFAVIREAMRGKEMVALARVVLAKRERVVMLEAVGQGVGRASPCATVPKSGMLRNTSTRYLVYLYRPICENSLSTFSKARPPTSSPANSSTITKRRWRKC